MSSPLFLNNGKEKMGKMVNRKTAGTEKKAGKRFQRQKRKGPFVNWGLLIGVYKKAYVFYKPQLNPN
jgi:hypothetical protein